MIIVEILRRIYRITIWHPLAIPIDEFKYRNLRRVWMPLYAAIGIYSGWKAVTQGSPLMNMLFPADLVDILGVVFTVAAVVAFVGIVIPSLWLPATLALWVIVGMIGSYIATIAIYGPTENPNDFVLGMLGFGLPSAFAYLNLLGEDWKERRHHEKEQGRTKESEQ